MTTRVRLWSFRIATAIGMPLLLLGLAEAGLRLAGVGWPSDFTIPCRVQGKDAWCDNDRFTWQFFPPGAFRLPHAFSIPAEKSPDTYRIFIVGESAAQGVPEPSYAFGRYLEAMLRDRFPATRFEVINTSISSINSHVLLPVTRDLARREPDLFIMYIGNNEVVGPYGPGTTLTRQGSALALIRASIFLKSLRIGQLLSGSLAAEDGRSHALTEWRGMRMFLDQQVAADSPAMPKLYANLRANLDDILAAARSSGAPVLISTVGVNLKDSAPFASLHRANLTDSERAAWDERMQAGIEAEQAGDPRKALASFLEAAAIDDHHAELHFRIARCRYALGDYPGARESYVRARDLDSLRFRADGPINAAVRAAAAAAGPGVTLIDGERVLAEKSPYGIPGREMFWEHVHMTPEGNYELARALLPHVVAQLPDRIKGSVQTVEAPSREAMDEAVALTPFDRVRVAARVIEWLGQPPFTHQLNHAEQVEALRREVFGSSPDLQATDAIYRRALERAPDDRWLHYNYGVFLKDRDPVAAVAELRRAIDILPSNHEARELLADTLATIGRYDDALAEVDALLERMPYHAPAHLTMAYALAQKGRYDESIAAYERAIGLNPSYAVAARNQIGVIRLHQGRYDLAAESFREAIAQNKNPGRTAELQKNLEIALAAQRQPPQRTAASPGH